MDTKWKKCKNLISFISFVLGISLILTTVTKGLWLFRGENWKNRIEQTFEEDYQNTDEFRGSISDYLESFLAMAVGGPVLGVGGYYYNYNDYGWNTAAAENMETAVEESAEAVQRDLEETYAEASEYGNEEMLKELAREYGMPLEDLLSGNGNWGSFYDGFQDNREPSETTKKRYAESAKRYHEAIKDDKNLLYQISFDGKVLYTNAEDGTLDGASGKAPKDYNFLLYFDGNKVTIQKDGGNLDIYGDGYYRENDSWRVPGYKNFTLDDETKKARVTIAAASSPKLYLKGNYSQDTSRQLENKLYWIEYHLRQQRETYISWVVMMAAGVFLLIVYVILRKGKKQIDERIASISGKLWFEFKVLLLAAVIGMFFLFRNQYITELAYMLADEGFYPSLVYEYGRELLSNTVSVLAVFWTAYLFINDLRYNKKAWKHSCIGKISELYAAGGMRMPFQKRILRSHLPLFIAGVLLFLLADVFLMYFVMETDDLAGPFCAILFMAAVGCFVWGEVVYIRRNKALLKDMEALIGQIDGVRDGNLTQAVPKMSDESMRMAAEHLGDIERGMDTAVRERIQSEQMKVELVSNVSHDIKTPLTSIISYVELLSQEEGLPDHVMDYIHILEQKSQRLKSMVQDVFEVSKAASGQLPMEPEPLDLGKLLRQTLADMSEKIQASSVTVREEIPEEAVMILADGQRLYRVFQNLLQNALQYSLDGSRVYVTLKTDGSVAVASVKNTSASEIPDDVNFTERFTRGDTSRTDGGSGLGLSIAKSFTEACGGKLKVETIADLFVVTVEFRVNNE